MTGLLIAGGLLCLFIFGSLGMWAMVHFGKSDDRAFDEFVTVLVLAECSDRHDYSLPRELLVACVPARADDREDTVYRLEKQRRIETCPGDGSRVRLSQRTQRGLKAMEWRRNTPPERLMEYEKYLKYAKATLRAEELRAARAA